MTTTTITSPLAIELKNKPEEESPSHSHLESLLSNALDKYRKNNATSLALFEEDLGYMPGANTRAVLAHDPFPVVIARGESARLWDVDGHEYIDFLGEFSAGIYGHNCQTIKDAVSEAMDKGWNFGGKNQYEGQLAKLVVDRFSNSMELVRFTNSGTEANLMALGAALNFTGKQNILVFLNAYHGSVLMFLEKNPKYSLNSKYDFVIAPYNDIPGTNAVLADLPPDSLAAIIVEPVQVSGGCIPGTRDFLLHLRELATAHEAVLIFDEIMTARLSYGGLQTKLGIKPDMTTVGKWLGGGMSFGAFGGSRKIMELFDPRTGKLVHSGTFNNNVVTMAAGVAGCQLMDEAKIDALNATGDRLRGKIAEVISGRLPTTDVLSPKIFVIGYGSLFAIRFRGPEQAVLSKLMYHYLLEKGIYIATRGFLALTVEVTDEHFEPLLRALEGFIDQYREHLV